MNCVQCGSKLIEKFLPLLVEPKRVLCREITTWSFYCVNSECPNYALLQVGIEEEV